MNSVFTGLLPSLVNYSELLKTDLFKLSLIPHSFATINGF